MNNRNKLLMCYTIIFALPLYIYAQLAVDTLLFTIPLINDASKQSLFNINGIKKVSDQLTGPIVMKNDNLLFYSGYGYVLYNQTGSVVDSHSVYKNGKDMPSDDPGQFRLAFPINSTTLLFYKTTPHGAYPLTIYEKKIIRGVLKPIREEEYPYYKEIQNKHICNIAFNTATDDMLEQYCILPRLVGFTSVAAGNKWWSVDKIPLLVSPLVNEKDGTFKSLFPGIQQEQNNINIQTAELLQIFTRDNAWFYTGISTGISIKAKKCSQTYYVFDRAGNLLYADSLLKLDNMDAIIGEDETTYYTVTKVKRSAFKPAVNKTGDVYYGIVDYAKKRIEVRKRKYFIYKASACGPALVNLIDVEKCIELIPSPLGYNAKTAGNPSIPQMIVLDAKKKKFIRAKEQHLIKNGYMCYISRSPYGELKKKLSNCRGDVPKNIQKTTDSLSKEPSIHIPYNILLTGPSGILRSFTYPPGEQIVCARILALHKKDELLVRVDCQNYAEALLFKTDGAFVNRFVFNVKNFEERQDILVATQNGPIIELDFESEEKSEKYLEWKKYLAD